MVLGLRVQLGGLHRAAKLTAALDDRSALEEQGFPMPIISSVLRSRCGSYYPFLSVRYILPLSDSKSDTSHSYR